MIFLQDTDLTLHHGDALTVLQGLPDESVHCVVTSPPYWGLRDYGTGSWAGGDPDCDHLAPLGGGYANSTLTHGPGQPLKQDEVEQVVRNRQKQYGGLCGKCGAQRTDNQLGLEPTPDAYITNMVGVFREVRRVLRRDGTCFMNMGDSFMTEPFAPWGLKPKDQAGIPHRLYFALQADGWYGRSDIVWAKRNCMPESVTDRPTKAHEYVFLLTRSARYFYDAEAIREKQGEPTRFAKTFRHGKYVDHGLDPGGNGSMGPGEDGYGESVATGRNSRSVWTIATQAFPEAHFATFPTELARRCILAGTSERGCCPECGAPWVREVDVSYEKSPVHGAGSVVGRHYETGANNYDGAGMPRVNKVTETLGWNPGCAHGDGDPFRPEHTVLCTVLDPFAGSGTVGWVARQHGRRSVLIELNEQYCQLIAERTRQLSLLA